MPGLVAIISEADVHADMEARLDSLRVEPWMSVARVEAVPGLVTLGRVSNGVLDSGRPLLAFSGTRICAVEGYFTDPTDPRASAGPGDRADRSAADLLLALAETGPVESWAERLTGAFTALLWDGESRTLTLIAERLGLRPHHVVWDGRNFAVAPSVRFLLELPWVSADLHPGSVVEHFAFQSVLEDRTVFRDVTVLPPHSVTTVTVEPRRRRTVRTWSFARIPSRDEIRFEDAVEETALRCRRTMRRHAAAAQRCGLFLSGGLDSRILLAAALPEIGPMPTFTFGHPDCRDVARARTLSRRAGAVNETHLLASGEWLREIADRHVELTDGAICLLHAHGLHMARSVREQVDLVFLGLTGGLTVGSHKLLRPTSSGEPTWTSTLDALHAFERRIYGIGFPDDETLRSLFTPDVWRDASVRPPRDALETALEPLRGCRPERVPQMASFLHRDRKALFTMLAALRPYFEVAMPYCDPDVLDFCLSLPTRHCVNDRLQKAVVERLAPRLAAVRMTRTDRPATRRLRTRLAWKLGRAARGAVAELTGGRLGRIERKPNTAYDEWLRSDLLEWMRSVLLDERTLRRGLFDPAFLRDLLEEPIPEGRAWTWQVGLTASFELMLRRLVDGDGRP